MIDEQILIAFEFQKIVVGELTYYIKGWVRLEKIFCGYLCNNPYKVISTKDELIELMK